MSKKAFGWIVVIVVILILIGVVRKNGNMNQNDSTTGDTIKIGVTVPLTGDAAIYGEGARDVYQIAAAEINKAGGINGKQIELIIEDSKCTGEGAVSAAQKLINVDGVRVILGGFCSGESLAIIPVAEAKGVALFSPGSSSPDLTGKSSLFFRNFPSDSTQGSTIAQAVYDQGKRKVAFLQEQTDYAIGVYKSFSEKFEQLGGTVTKVEYPTVTKDFRSQLTKIKSENPDAIFIDSQTPAASDLILQQAATLGIKTPLLMNDGSMGDPAVLLKHKVILEGALGAEFGVDQNNAKFKNLVEAYKAQYNKDLPYPSYAQTEYDAVYMLKDAISAVGYDGKKIAEWGHNVKNWQGASGLITIDSNGDRVGGHRLEIIKNGKVEVVK